MFNLADTPVKFVGLLVLFAFSTIWSLYQLSHRQSGPTLVSNLAHLAMSAVMLLMVSSTLWQPMTAIVGVPALVGLFGACTLWFVILGVRGLSAGGGRARTHGWHALGHAAMFAAMTWHLAAMLGHAAGGHHHATQTGGESVAVAVIGVPFMAYLLLASIWSLKNVISPGPDVLDHVGHERAGHGQYASGSPRLAALADFAMTFGMFWMSTGLLIPLVPFLRVI